MDIYKPKAERQKRQHAHKRPRGAVMQTRQQQAEPFALRLKKQWVDMGKLLLRSGVLPNVRWLMLCVVALLFAGAWVGVRDFKANMPIQYVTVRGDFQQLDRRLLEETVAPLVGRNYFDLQVSEIKQSLHAFAWVQSVEVRKKWPDSVELVVVENKAIATWGEDSLVNEFGKIFTPQHINRDYLQGLPDLHGMKQHSDLVLGTYARLSEMSEAYQIKISSFSLIANRYWLLTLNNGVEVLLARGAEDQSMLTFLKAWDKEFSASEKTLARVDMRYSNGFSVQFSDKLMSADIKMEEQKQTVRKHHG